MMLTPREIKDAQEHIMAAKSIDRNIRARLDEVKSLMTASAQHLAKAREIIERD